MSKRTAATQSGRPRQRTLIPRLSDVRIQSKLGLILLVPVLAVVALAGIELASAGQTLVGARRVDSTIKLSNQAGTLIQELQNERLAAAQVLLTNSRSARTTLTDDFKRQNGVTDQQIAAYKEKRANVTDLPSAMTDELNLIDNQLDALSKNGRLEVLSPSDATVASVTFRYQVLISELLDLRQSVVALSDDTTLSSELSANAALSQAKEYAAQEQLALLRVIADRRGFDSTSFETFLGTLTGQQSSYDAFTRNATEEQLQLLQDEVNGPHVQDSTALETEARTDGLGNALSITPTSWNKAMAERINAIRGVERELDAQTAAHSQDVVASVVRKVIAESAAGLLVLLVAIVLALLVARAMARSLRRLREGALRVAYEGLPQAVAQLGTADSIGGLSPDEIANQVGDAIAVQGRDEIGQVSEAFNVVHREAVKTAAGQAVLRASVSTMFINLARRSQLLVDRLIGHLDRLEQGEEDPDRLAQLFQLDHLATRMRRNDENLLVLAGADSTRARREAAPLGDVLRAAQSEVEQYTRIEFGVVDRDVEVEATAVNDVVHLIAELLDNATAFSSPDTAVVVDARRVGDRAIVQIEDRGIGMSAEVLDELNERLANPAPVDVAVSRMMGLVVVGRLASRLGIRIELRRAAERGTIAEVTLPTTVLVPMDRPGQQPRSAGLPGQSTPLALEPSGAVEPPRPTSPAPAPPGDTMPGIPFQPAARDTLADAANGHRHGNGTSGLPRRSPTRPAGDPEPSGGPGEPTRRSLFDPPPRKAAQEATGAPSDGYDETGASSWSSAGRDDDRTDQWAASSVDRTDRWALPAADDGADQPPSSDEASRPDVADRWAALRSGAGLSAERDDGTQRRPAERDNGTQRGPAERDGADGRPGERQSATDRWSSTAAPAADTGTTAGGLPRRPTAPAASGDRSEQAPVERPPRPAVFDDLTVETPRITRGTGWNAAGEAGSADESQQVGNGRSSEDVSPRSGLDSAAPEPVNGSGGRTEIIPRNVDDTMELPIFREVESAWFRTSPSRPRSGPAVTTPSPSPTPAGPPATRTVTPDPVADTPRPERKRPTVLPTRPTTGSPAPAGPAPSAPASTTPSHAEIPARPTTEVPSEGRPDIDPWASAADKGWQAASAVFQSPKSGETTNSGLPKRRPMAQLVPGGVEEPVRPARARERSPEAVRGLLSAYHRGVQRGRAGGVTPRATPVPGHRSTGDGAGEEQEA